MKTSLMDQHIIIRPYNKLLSYTFFTTHFRNMTCIMIYVRTCIGIHISIDWQNWCFDCTHRVLTVQRIMFLDRCLRTITNIIQVITIGVGIIIFFLFLFFSRMIHDGAQVLRWKLNKQIKRYDSMITFVKSIHLFHFICTLECRKLL